MGEEEQEARTSKFGELVPNVSHVVVKSQGEVYRVQCGAPKGPQGDGLLEGPRGDRRPCTYFSARSRNGMLEAVKRVDWSAYEVVCFVTLTYPPECWRGWREAGYHRRAFVEWLRRFCKAQGVPMCSGFWKKEPHPNRPDVLHFHLLIFGLPFLPQERLAKVWGRIIRSRRSFGAVVEIENVGGSDGAAKYVSKRVAQYVTKGNEGSSLVSSTNVHGGRWWGTWNRRAIPWAKVDEVLVPRGHYIYRMKRLARRHRLGELSRKFGRKCRRCRGYSNNTPGFRVLVKDTGRWWAALKEFVQQDLDNPKPWRRAELWMQQERKRYVARKENLGKSIARTFGVRGSFIG